MIYILKVTIQFSHSPFPVNDEQGYFESGKMSHCPWLMELGNGGLDASLGLFIAIYLIVTIIFGYEFC